MKMIPIAAALAFALPNAPATADIHAVVVGVDKYQRLNPLNGAANDARDLAGVLTALGAEVELLVDADATRRSVIQAFARQAGRAGPGDMFVFTYAGHGLQEPEAIAGDESDGMDETIVFAGFGRNGAPAGERLRDNEIGELLTLVSPEARALIVIDSCHSGTMTRAADPRGVGLVTRFGGIGRISDDPLPKPPDATKGLDLAGDNIVFVAAARDDEQIPEVEIEGQMRGAVSWTVARAFEGAEGFGGPSMTLGEFRSYVRAQARALAAARQTPSVSFRAAFLPDDAAIVPQSARAGPAPTPAPRDDGGDRPALVYALGGAATGDLGAGGTWATERAGADLVWDAPEGELIDNRGADLVAEAWDAADISAAVEKWRAVRRLTNWAARRHAGFRITPDDGRHRLGEMVGLEIARPLLEPEYLTIVNLASDGRVQFVFPDDANRALAADLIQPGEGFEKLGEVEVTHPVGADHVVAILSAERPVALHEWLEGGGGERNAEAFVTLLRAMAAQGDHRIGVTPIFTMR
ncbi:hypothetical protein G5B40_13460 [Pikeienuella piscinae]|uniref:Caspase family p20 domain-containing protein n=1 Tax=Pikeienuella piscinae TaxID=2748098 RepID=A0A7L5C3D5_9RHOB|nr:caspase family protein [Pikeienuella piscinae]QIE56379.1 hypothetical protein G5B40_13460 [Pikeienuella piscinae]